MSSSASLKKEKVLRMLASLTPRARVVVLSAALEQKALQADVQKSKNQEETIGCTLISK